MTKFSVLQCLNSQTHLGHKTSEWNPNMASFILGQRLNHHVLDISKQQSSLKRALRVASQTAASVGTDGILFMGKSPKTVGSARAFRSHNPYEQILKNSACSVGASYFNGDTQVWVNGTFTNWQQTSKASNSGFAAAQGSSSRKYVPGLDESHAGAAANPLPESTHTLEVLTNNRMALPSLIFAIGVSNLEQPLREAHKVGIPIIGVLDSDCNPRISNQFIDYIIPGNDDSIRSYAFFCSLISQAIQEGKQKIGA